MSGRHHDDDDEGKEDTDHDDDDIKFFSDWMMTYKEEALLYRSS